LHDCDPDLYLVFIAKISKQMNVLILTPDAVGSTLLQRLTTIYMQFHGYDRPVINLHELTNGLVRYHNDHFNQDVLGKREGAWGYHQSLEEIVSLLSSVDHYKTSRLAHYHIRNRRDSLEDQLSFYRYLNENFYIISCRRHNIFEHALSWCLSKVTKKLNVYSSTEKINSFFDFYRNGIDLDPNSLLHTLNAYRDYIHWCNDHFDVANYFLYEDHLPNIERYILNLPIFSQVDQRLTWQNNFGMTFNQWNMCHYLGSDLGTLALDSPEQFQQLAYSSQTQNMANRDAEFLTAYEQVRDPTWPQVSTMSEYEQLPEHIRNEVEHTHGVRAGTDLTQVNRTTLAQNITQLLPAEHQEFLQQHQPTYYKCMADINKMVTDGVMISHPPIKKQTLAEKKHMIRNYQHLLSVYNTWIKQYPDLGQPLSDDVLDQFAQHERANWHPSSSNMVVFDPQNTDKS
jgi:hypothetical protein